MAYDGSRFIADMAPAGHNVTVVPAHPSNLMRDRDTGEIKAINRPKVLVLHSPEEPVDNYESTPAWFAQPDRDGSTHYYISGGAGGNDGTIYQIVPEKYGAIANGVRNRPYPRDTDPSISLNYQSLSVEIEGYAVGMHRTCPPGSIQWNAVRMWIIHRAAAYHIPIDTEHIITHASVADNRTDPGTLDVRRLVLEAADVARRIIQLTEEARATLAIRTALMPAINRGDWVMVHNQLHYIHVGN